jgi:hypothetical protein
MSANCRKHPFSGFGDCRKRLIIIGRHKRLQTDPNSPIASNAQPEQFIPRAQIIEGDLRYAGTGNLQRSLREIALEG